MSHPVKTSELSIGNRKLIVRTGHMARQASAAVTVQLGETVVLATVVGAKTAKEGQDFFPLTVEYLEKSYAAGMIPGGFFKREGRSTEKEILTSRLTDRPIRPLFPEGYLNEVQIVVSVLSSDNEIDPDIPCILSASLALMLSEIPFLGPVGAVRVAEIAGQLVLNPTYEELKKATLDLVVAGTRDGVTMIESEAAEISEARVVEALEFGHRAIRQLVDFQEEFARGIAKPKVHALKKKHDPDLEKRIQETARPAFKKVNEPKTKQERDAAVSEVVKDLSAKFAPAEGKVAAEEVKAILHDLEYDEVRRLCLYDHKRVDGRKLDEIRTITSEVGLLPRTHGSSLFTRGQTQSLGVVTLGTARDEQLIESYEGVSTKNFLLHYNFPPFSVGEIKMLRGPGRREIGHGALAWRGLRAVIPAKNEFPYTIRFVSDILESNGSSSMATICSGTLALMDAGVPIKRPVSGIAMGLIKEGKDWVVLSDIAGVEDHLGDMDFKVAGTERGITTLQLDIKLKEGLDFPILAKALEQAKVGRLHILGKMLETMTEPRKTLSPYAPSITTLKVAVDKISEIIGPGGKMIRKITKESGAEVEIEDDGTVRVISRNRLSADKALDMLRDITKEAEVGKVYRATVKRIMGFGAFCEIMPGKEGLLHISEITEGFIDRVDDVLKVGDQFEVKVLELDSQGRVNLSAKAVPGQPFFADIRVRPKQEPRPRNERGEESFSKRGPRY